MPRRTVRLSDAFLQKATSLYPPGGSVVGHPTYEHFEEGPLRAARAAFAVNFEALTQPIPGVGGVRLIVTQPTPAFGPLVISAVLLDNDVVEIVDIEEDPDYWEVVNDDPE